MSTTKSNRLSRGRLRSGIRLTYTNALLWALGNGLVSTTLVVYLALELGASGSAIAWILAAPRVAGVLRLTAPSLIAGFRKIGFGRRSVFLCGYALSSVALTIVPATAQAAAQSESTATLKIALLAAVWCVYHVLEYIAGVALWSWIGDLYPGRLRAKLLGGRERWLTSGRLVGIGVSVALALLWSGVTPSGPRWAPLAASATIGAALMMLAITPLALAPSLAESSSASPEAPWRTLRRALAEKPYRRLLTFSCWFGFANGITASAQAMYPLRVLGVDYPTIQLLRAGMRGGQAAIAPGCGAAVSKWGAKCVMLPAQLIVSTGPAWFLLASPDQPLWIVAAFVAWVSYAALNVGLDTLKLNLADKENNSPYLAVYHAFSDLANALTVLLGGLLYDTLAMGDSQSLRVYSALFIVGWIARTLCVGLILRLDESGIQPPVAATRRELE